MTATLATLAQKIGTVLRQHGLVLVTAESCTGGGLGNWITSVAGSSAWYRGGYITYSNQMKIASLGVNPITLDVFGAVNEQTAREMAEGALNQSQADVSIAITGVAGPNGGTKDKPVGTVWFAWARRGQPTVAQVELFDGNRQEIREQAIAFAMSRLLVLY